MQDQNSNQPNGPTIHEMIRALGERTNIAPAAHKLLTERGHKFSLRAVYTTIERNGSNNSDIALALFDAIAAEKKKRAGLAQSRAAAVGA